MTKADLRTGMIVTVRSGCKYMVFLNAVADNEKETDIIVDIAMPKCWNKLEYYKNDLLYCGLRADNDWNKKFDIMKVSKPKNYADFIHNIQEGEVIWERKEVKEVTMAEIEKKFGCKVKIVS